MDQPVQVKALEMTPGYVTAIMLLQPLTVSGSDDSSKLVMNTNGVIRGFADIATGEITRGTLNLGEKTVFSWLAGGLADVTVQVARTGNDRTRVDVGRIPGGPTPTGQTWMRNATLNVAGDMIWFDGNVPVYEPLAGQPRSAINILPGGSFLIGPIGPNDRTWGTNTADLEVNNQGFVSVFLLNDTATIKGNYTNLGETKLVQGTLTLAGLAEQGGPSSSFEIGDDATVALTSSTLGIRQGIIRGGGTIQGNLVLGNDPNAQGYDPAVHGVPLIRSSLPATPTPLLR